MSKRKGASGDEPGSKRREKPEGVPAAAAAAAAAEECEPATIAKPILTSIPEALASCYALVNGLKPLHELINAYFMGPAESLVYLTPEKRYHLYLGSAVRDASMFGELCRLKFTSTDTSQEHIARLDYRFDLISSQVRLTFEDVGGLNVPWSDTLIYDGYVTLDTGPMDHEHYVNQTPNECVWVICDPDHQDKRPLVWVFLEHRPMANEVNEDGTYGPSLNNQTKTDGKTHIDNSIYARAALDRSNTGSLHNAVLRRLAIQLHERRLRPHPFRAAEPPEPVAVAVESLAPQPD
jgi:hypothetical protein